MRKLFAFAAFVVTLVVSSCSYDDTPIWDKLNDHEERIKTLEELCTNMNTNIEALQGIVEALEKHDYIVDVVENEDGYTINFAKGNSITIKNGKDGANGNDGANGADGADGADGQTPVIGVAEEDGVYYWTVNGEWLTDANGNKIKAVGSDGANGADGNDGANGADGANGNDGVTPQLKIEDNKWFVSYDEGATWVELGIVAEGDVVVANPIEVTEDEKYVYFKLSDDQVITIAKVTPLEIEFESISDAVTGSLVKVGYTITTTAESVEVEAIAAKNVADVEVVKGEGNTGVINITVGENEGESKVLVFVGDETRVIMRSITINLEKAAIEFATEDNATIAVGAEGGNVALKFLTNVDVKVVESADWIEEASTRAMVEKRVDLTVLANEGTERSAEVVIEAVDSPALSIKYVINQEGKPIETYKMYFNNVANWTDVYAHIWANDGEDLGLESVEWPGRKLTETEEIDGVTYYVFALPAEATGKTINVVFNDGNGTQTADLSGVANENLFFDNEVKPAEPSDVVLYLEPNANWNIDGARFAAYFFGNGETWVDMVLVEGETNIYAVTVPAGFEKIIFCRMNPNTTENNWNNKWNQTADLTIPTDGTNLYTVAEETWDNGGGVWSVYPRVTEPEEPEAEVLATLDAEAYYLFKQATEIKGGKWYAIVSEANAATALTSNYGYLKITQALARTEGISLPALCAFGFMTTEGGYTIQQYDAKYVYQTGTYNSFNVSATAPEAGGVWSVAVDGNAFSITNNSVSKTIQYDSQYNSYGSYANITATIPTLYELVEVDTTPMITDLSTNSISVACDGGNSTVTVSTYGESTLSVSDDADWVSTSISDNVVTITVDANSGAAREANVTITYGEDSKSVAIAQAEFKEEGETSTYTDTLTSDMFAATSTTYTAFSGVEGKNGAVYAGKSAKSQNGGYIQLRSSKSEDGIVTTASGGKVKKVVVEWDEANTAAGRTLDVYVSNTPYTSATELYNTVVGEKIGNIVKGTSTELTIDGDYEYLGLRSNNGAMYIKSITITYEK